MKNAAFIASGPKSFPKENSTPPNSQSTILAQKTQALVDRALGLPDVVQHLGADLLLMWS